MTRRLCGEENYPLALLAVAGFALPGASRAFPREPLDDESWASLLSAAHTHRLTGLLRAAIDQGPYPPPRLRRTRLEPPTGRPWFACCRSSES